MELAAIFLLPALAAAISLSPAGRRLAAPATLAANAVVLVLAVRVAVAATRTGRVDALDGWLTCDALAALVLVLVAFVAVAAALFSWGYVEHRNGSAGDHKFRQYYGLYNLFVLAMLAVPILANIALMWIAVELTTLVSAFLVGFENTAEALEAAWKFVVLTTLGAVVALLGVLILYWESQLAGPAPFTWAGLVAAAPQMPPALLWPAFLLIFVGFGTKIGIVPLHTWMPDAYSQAPAPICALLSGVETTVALYVILRLLPVIGLAPGLDARPWLVGFGLLSVGVATLLLVFVRDFKRLFAFSTIEHMGIILVAAGLGGADAHLGATYQMTAHAIAKSFCFFAAGATVLAVGTQEIAAVRNLARSSPLAALALVAGGLAIAGAPPFALFVSEFLILKGGLASGQFVTVALLAVLVFIAFCAVMVHVNCMAFGAGERRTVRRIPLACKATIALAAIPLVVIGVYVPDPLRALLTAAAAAIGG
ncbi:MAG TPA: proton-conducting transporter membrane subunit [Stellaceae bacterium]|jgi:hydrogenase-4 component F|nr:proton-conducting transporter membrane subunit [Stellaceae bacterium]